MANNCITTDYKLHMSGSNVLSIIKITCTWCCIIAKEDQIQKSLPIKTTQMRKKSLCPICVVHQLPKFRLVHRYTVISSVCRQDNRYEAVHVIYRLMGHVEYGHIYFIKCVHVDYRNGQISGIFEGEGHWSMSLDFYPSRNSIDVGFRGVKGHKRTTALISVLPGSDAQGRSRTLFILWFRRHQTEQNAAQLLILQFRCQTSVGSDAKCPTQNSVPVVVQTPKFGKELKFIFYHRPPSPLSMSPQTTDKPSR